MSKNVPELRFKGFEDEWEKIHLSDSVERVVRKNKGNVTNRPLTISAQYGLVNQEEFFNKVVASKNLEGYYLLNNGEFAYNKSYSNGYPFGAIKRLDKYKNGAVSTLYICFKPKLNVDSDFLTQYFESSKWYREVSMVAVEGARNHGLLNIGVSDFFDTIHRFPSLQEQEKIANFLSKVDSIIEKQEKKVEYWNSYKKGMMQKIFSQKIRFKDGNGRDYPEWEEEKLGGIGQTYTGLSGKTKDDFGFGNGKYITYVNIFKNTKVDINMFDLVDIKKDEKQNKVLKGDILFTASSETPNEVGMASVCDNNIENLYLNSFCFGFRLNSKKDIDYIFIGYLLRSPSLRKKISILAQGSTRYNLSKSEFMKIKIQIPCLEEQRKIVNFLSNIDNIIEKENKKLEELKQWKKGLLQQMFV
ncbi:restriction endonuclease subunit S [Clostridium perfringens]|nr:restriction endonuclease subunit S [Clostridium perfringens]